MLLNRGVIMGVEIISGEKRACFMCNTTDTAFGPVMKNYSEARQFLDWLDKDPREYVAHKLRDKYWNFRRRGER